jgi:hypothetical protein
LVDAAPASPSPTSLLDLDPAKDGVYERKMFKGMREKLHNALLGVERRRDDVARLETRNAYLEGELKLQERHLLLRSLNVQPQPENLLDQSNSDAADLRFEVDAGAYEEPNQSGVPKNI